MTQTTLAKASSRARRLAKANDVLISTVRPYLKAFVLLDDPPKNLVCSTGFAVLRPGPDIDSRYLYQCCLTAKFVEDLSNKMTGSNYPAVRPSDVAETLIPLPPLPEQRRIAEILGSVDGMMEVPNRVVNNQSMLMTRIMHDHFIKCDGMDVKVKDFADVQTGPFGSLLKSSDFTDNGLPLLSIGNVQQGYLNLDTLSHVGDATADRLVKYRLAEGDLLFSRMATIGRTCTVPKEAHGWLMSYHLLRLRVRSPIILPRYLMYSLIGNPNVTYQVTSQSSGGTRSGVNTSILENLTLRVPPVDVQTHIVELLDGMHSLISANTLAVQRSLILEQSLLRSLFGPQGVPA